jgi:NAD(P)-dependent dehydrogenase (short-subunit alcohol dehydrogenase family)
MVAYDFRGQTLVVTGGASGIGAGICTAFADAGGAAVCLDANRQMAEQLEASYKGAGTLRSLVLDVRDARQVTSVFEQVLTDYGHLDGLVMSAAIQPRIDIADMSDDDWHRVIDTNLSGVFYCSRAVVPHMKSRRRGSIVTFSSGLALQGWASTSAYAATKAGLIGFTKSLAREMAPYRVRANVIHPGITDSPLFTGTKTAEELQFFKKTMGAVGTVADVVQLLMFFLSDASSSLTGLFINRDIILPD